MALNKITAEPLYARTSLPLLRFQSRAVPSMLAVSIDLPSGENATLVTPPVCPLKIRTRRPTRTSHSRAVQSLLPVSAYLPSGEKATLKISLQQHDAVSFMLIVRFCQLSQ